jgi:hypothetical protein
MLTTRLPYSALIYSSNLCTVVVLPANRSVNGTRRARWDARMGYQMSAPFTVNMRSLIANGGVAPRLRAIVMRVYPQLFFDSETKIHRNEKAEDYVRTMHEKEMGLKMERHRTQMMMNAERNGHGDGGWDTNSVMDGFDRSSGERNISPYIKVRLRELGPNAVPSQGSIPTNVIESSKMVTTSECILTIWRPPQALLRVLTEGSAVTVTNATVTKGFTHGMGQCIGGGELLPHALGTTRLTQVIPLVSTTPIVQQSLIAAGTSLERRILTLESLDSLKPGIEFDMVGIVVAIGQPEAINTAARRYPSSSSSSPMSSATSSPNMNGNNDMTRRRVFIGGPGARLLVLEVTESSEQRHFSGSGPPPIGSLILLRNIIYSSFDVRFHLHTATLSSYSIWTLKPQRPNISIIFIAMDHWLSTPIANMVIHMQIRKAQLLLSGGLIADPPPELVGVTTIPCHLSFYQLF